MNLPPNTIIELPTDLWHSPFFDFYYNLGIGSEEHSMDRMGNDLRCMFKLSNMKELDYYLFALKSAYRAGFVRALKLNWEDAPSPMRIMEVCPYTDEPMEAVRWLLELTQTVHSLRHPYLRSGVALSALEQQSQGALLVPLSTA